MAESSSECCYGCRFWLGLDNGSHPGDEQGYCRRRAPVTSSESSRGFPVTNESEWCGEFELKP